MSTPSTMSTLLPHRGSLGAPRSGRGHVPGPDRAIQFFCTWEQSTRALQSKSLLLTYYLRDDTIELRQAPDGASEEAAFALSSEAVLALPLVLKRQRVCKPNYQSSQKPESGGARPNRPAASMYHYADLAVGKPIAVYGMNLLLCAADGAAAAHYAGLGIPLELDSSDEMAASLMATSTEPQLHAAGTLTRSPSTAGTAFLNYTQRGTQALRFKACMVNAPGFTCSGSDVHRVFVVTFHLDDDTLEVAEPPNKATRTGGPCFLARAPLDKPCMHDPYGSEGRYCRRDMFVGAFVPLLLRARKGFEAEGPKMLWLVEADEWTLDAMESRPHDFPASDMATACAKFAAEMQDAARAARVSELLGAQAQGGAVATDAFADALITAGCDVSLQECVTLARSLGSKDGRTMQLAAFCAAYDVPAVAPAAGTGRIQANSSAQLSAAAVTTITAIGHL